MLRLVRHVFLQYFGLTASTTNSLGGILVMVDFHKSSQFFVYNVNIGKTQAGRVV